MDPELTELRVDLTKANPYDFRNPVRPQLLVGREDELREIERHLAGAREGRPVHIALLGERAAGKTSLLRAIDERARALDLLSVRVDLDEAVTSSPFSFFKAIFEAAIQALLAVDALNVRDPRYAAWRRQVYAGAMDVSADEELLMFGLLAASVTQGNPTPDISPSLLETDCDRIAQIAEEAGWRGLLLIVDEGDLIGENHALIQKLRNLVQATSRWMLVLAGTHRMFGALREVFSPIPRQFVRINVEPFDSIGDVFECIARPLELADATPNASKLPYAIVSDIYQVTSGRPYEINLVCYYVWDALQQGLQTEFEVSDVVLDNVLKELVAIGKTERLADANELDTIRRLSADDFELAVQVLPFEGYSLEEHTLSLLFPADYDRSEYERTKSEVQAQIEKLERLEVVERMGDRFRLTGGAFARV
jgi:hypothetical protein